MIRGKRNSVPEETFALQLFANPGSSKGEGKVLVGEKTVTTDGSGDATFVARLRPKIQAGRYVTATATNESSSDTSEFSVPRAVR